MRLTPAVLVFAIASKANAGEGIQSQVSHDQLDPLSHAAYHRVENTCARDVETFCDPEVVSPSMFYISGDPFFDWIFGSSTASITASPPELNDLDQFLDQMFNSFAVYSVSTIESSSETPTTTFYDVLPQLYVEAGVTRLAAEKEPEEIPQLAHQLQKYGANLLRDAEVGSNQHEMARRLTEMDTKTINYHVRLPFGQKNCCLRRMFEENNVSGECAHSIRMLESTFVLETEINRRRDSFVNAMLLHNIFMLSFAVLLFRNVRRRRFWRRLMKQKIVNTVYNNPSIRRQVELEIGESIDFDVKRNSRVSCRERKTTHNKDIVLAKKIVCEGVPLQVV